MLDFPRWKTWSISLVILIGILFAIPSMLPADLKARYPTWLPSATINLGLDLAGGSQLLLEADQADAAKQRLQAMEDQVATELRRNPRVEIGDVSTAGGRVSFLVRDPTQVDTAVERLRAITQPVALTGSRDWDVQVDGFDPDRADADAKRVAARDARRDVGRPRRGPPPYRPAGHQGNHRHQPGHRPDPRRGSGRRGSRGAEEPDRPDRAPGIQAGRPDRRPEPGRAGPCSGGKPGPADGRGRRQHRGQAPGDGFGRPAGRRQADLRPGRPRRRFHQLQHRGRAAFRPRHAGKRQQAFRDHPRRQGSVGAEHQRADPWRAGADQRELHGRDRQPARRVARLRQAAGEAERHRGADHRSGARQGFDSEGHHRQRRGDRSRSSSSCSSPMAGSASTRRWR